MININTNIPSLIAQRSLNNSTQLLNQAIERMTTGFKINHASDNAANYSISTNMGVKLSSYAVAEDNVAMGLDLLSTAGGSLDLISDKLSRLRALAEQAANGTYGEQSLNAINAEASAIIDEMLRTKSTTEYNGKKLFGETVGPDMSKLKVNSDGFIQDIKRRNTASMTSLESVDESAVLAKGTYSISSAEELAKLARMQNSGKITDGSEFVLGADIDLSAYDNWTPIGWEDGNAQTDKAFSGTFDGNGYKIKNLNSKSSDTSAAGLFGSTEDACFLNLGLENLNLQGKFVGGLVGILKNDSTLTINNCYATEVQITGSGNSGGLVGGKDKKAHIKCNTEINMNSCYTEMQIEGCPWDHQGGIIGCVDNSSIENCFSIVNSQNTVPGSAFGGIAGFSLLGTISNCYSTGYIETTSAAGGIAAGGDLTIKNCGFEGTINGGNCVGGINGGCHGSNPVYIENCFVKADIIGNERVGGISGWLDCEGGYVKNCQFIGTLHGTSASTDIGSIVGGGVADILTVENCSYDKSLCGELPAIGDGLGISNNITDIGLETILQVGINSDVNSQISFDTFFDLTDLYSIYLNGVDSENAFKTIDNLSQKISATQTHLGSVENRLESALEEISTQYENLTSSRSTLRDADIAEVSSEYIRQQILQQASATLMATANQSPALALQLL